MVFLLVFGLNMCLHVRLAVSLLDAKFWPFGVVAFSITFWLFGWPPNSLMSFFQMPSSWWFSMIWRWSSFDGDDLDARRLITVWKSSSIQSLQRFCRSTHTGVIAQLCTRYTEVVQNHSSAIVILEDQSTVETYADDSVASAIRADYFKILSDDLSKL